MRDISRPTTTVRFAPSATGEELWIGEQVPNALRRIDYFGNTTWTGFETEFAPGFISLSKLGRVYTNTNGRLNYLTESLQLAEGPGTSWGVESVDISKNGLYGVASGWDARVRRYSMGSGIEWKNWTTNDHIVHFANFVPDNRIVTVDEGSPGNLKVYDMSGNLLSPPNSFTAWAPAVSPVRHPAYGYCLAFADGPSVKIMRLTDYAIPRALNHASDSVHCLTFSADGSRLASGSEDGKVRIYRTSDWALLRTIDLAAAVSHLEYGPSGNRLFAGTSQAGASLISMRKPSGGEAWTVDPPITHQFNQTVSSISASKDGMTVLVGYGDFRQYYVPDMSVLKTWSAGNSPEASVFSPQNDKILWTDGTSTTICMANPFPCFVETMSTSPSSIKKGESSTLTVRTSFTAPQGGVVVSLSDTTSSVYTPTNVQIPAGQRTATASLLTVPGSIAGTYTITGTLFGKSATTTLTIQP